MPARTWHPPPGTKTVLGIDGDRVATVKALYKKLGLTWKKHDLHSLRLGGG